MWPHHLQQGAARSVLAVGGVIFFLSPATVLQTCSKCNTLAPKGLEILPDS